MHINDNTIEVAEWYECAGEVESRVAKCESPFMALIKCQTLLTGFPYWDVSRVWSETTDRESIRHRFPRLKKSRPRLGWDRRL